MSPGARIVLPRLALVTVALALGAAGAASAATVAIAPRACAYSGQHVLVGGSGYPPGVPFSATVNGALLASGTTNVQGIAEAETTAPALDRTERGYTVSIAAGGVSASTDWSVTSFDAAYLPSSGSPRRRVRFVWHGLGARRTVYLHYVPPGSRRALRTIRLGKGRGLCGKGSVRVRHLYPYSIRLRSGRWRLQLDRKRRYSRATRPYIAIFSRISVF
jgi:hypothetical protein